MGFQPRPDSRSRVCADNYHFTPCAEAITDRGLIIEMAGNIIPAIATTNAVIAGYIVMRAINILQNDWSKCSNVYLRGDPARLIAPIALQPPEDNCGVCADVYVPLACDVDRLTLGSFVGEIVRSWLGWNTNDDGDQMEIAVYEDKRLLADPDFEDNYGKTLADLGISRGKTLTVTDEDNLYRNVNFSICASYVSRLMDIEKLRSTDYFISQTYLCQLDLPLALECPAGPEATQGS